MNDAKSLFKKTTPVNQIKPIAAYLREQEEILERLSTIIDNEYQALKSKQFDSLGEISRMKSNFMVKLQANDQRIKLHPEVERLKTDLAQRVEGIKAKLKYCQYKNSVNGNLIKLCMQSNLRLGAMVVSARDNLTRNKTYNAKGYAQARGISHLSIEA